MSNDVSELEICLKEFSILYDFIDTMNWKIESGYETEDNQTYINISRNVSDTTQYLELQKTELRDERTTSKNYRILKNIISYSYGGYEYYVYLIGLNDTLYFFREKDYDRLGPGNEEFFIGKYKYQYHFGRMKQNQAAYYLMFKDSLDNVKGNPIDILP